MGCGSSKPKEPSKPKVEPPPPQPPPPPRPTFDPSKEAPTPPLLRSEQKRYLETNIPVDKDGSGVPEPHPTSLEAPRVDPKDYAFIDEHAKTVPAELLLEPLSNVVEYLVQPAGDEVTGKARAFYTFLAHAPGRLQQMVDCNESLEVPDKNSTLYELLRVEVKVADACRLFSIMCKLAGVTCKEIQGKRKPVSTPHLSIDHTWCAILVQEHWHLVDVVCATSGCPPHAGKVDKSPSRTSGRSTKQNTPANNKASAYHDTYFLANPVEFVYTHLPKYKEWQLLGRPLEDQEFMDFVTLHDGYFAYDMDRLSEYRGQIQAVEGQLSLEFPVPHSRPLVFECTLMKRQEGGSYTASVDGESLKHCVLVTSTDVVNGKKIVQIQLPWAGQYRLQIAGTDPADGSQRIICVYTITCATPCFAYTPNTCPEVAEWGIVPQALGLGLKPVSHPQGKVVLEHGTGTVTMSRDVSQSLEYLMDLAIADDKVKKSLLLKYVKFYEGHDDLSILLRAPFAGTYILRVFARESDLDGEFVNVCTYMVISHTGCDDLTPFPFGKNQMLGAIVSRDDPLFLVPRNHAVPYVEILQEDSLSVRMSASSAVELSFRYEWLDDKERQELPGFVWCHQTDLLSTVSLRFPKAGMYGLEVFARRNGSASHFQEVYRYLLMVDDPSPKCLPYPSIANWVARYTLYQPIHGLLEGGARVTYSVKVDDRNFQAMFLYGDKWSGVEVDPGEEEGMWEMDIPEVMGGQTVTLAGLYDDGDLAPLLTYQVLDDNLLSSVKAAQKKAAAEAEARRDRLSNRKQQQAKAAESARRRQQEKEDQAKMDLEDNREGVIQEEQRQLAAEKEVMEENQKKEKDLRKLPPEEERVLIEEYLHIKKEQVVPESLSKTSKKKSVEPESHSETPVRKKKPVVEPDGPPPEPSSPPGSPKPAKRSGHHNKSNMLAEIRAQLLEKKLKEAISLRKVSVLEESIEAYREGNIKQDERLVRKALFSLKVARARQAIKEAVDSRDSERIDEAIADCERQQVDKYLQPEIKGARKLQVQLSRGNGSRQLLMNMNKSTLSEIHGYTKPPALIHPVLQATLLLLGYDENVTSSWSECQVLTNPSQSNKFGRQIATYDLDSLHPEIKARAKEILDSIEFQKVQTVSPCAAAFYVWSMGCIDDSGGDDQEQQSDASPASVDRQKEIFDELRTSVRSNRI